jgi:4-amino-4-deoxy-L-arabinose transferase-like glycosyltransferase
MTEGEFSAGRIIGPVEEGCTPVIASLRGLAGAGPLLRGRVDGAVATRLGFLTCLAIIFAVRAVVAAKLPLAFDEAYYWMWSKSLAGGYFDHPPLIALVIRLGTRVAGDTEFGVRLGSLVLAAPATWAVMRAAWLLFADVVLARWAALFLNLTLLVCGVSITASPDTPLFVASAFVLLCLAEIAVTDRPQWWIGVGFACGLALLAKYSALTFGLDIVIWLALVPRLRHWFASPWLYLGGSVALLLFAPVIAWNYAHDFASFWFQFGRIHVESFDPRYFFEMLPAQVVLISPPIFVLGVAGLIWLGRRARVGNAKFGDANALLIACLTWPLVAYLVWHSAHERVEGNWLLPIYPPFAIAAAFAMRQPPNATRAGQFVAHARRWALPISAAMFLIAAAQSLSGFIRISPDPLGSKIGFGWPKLAIQVRDVVARTGASGILTSDYHTTAWLSFYLPDVEVAQVNERIRWVNMPPPSDRLMRGPVLFFASDKITLGEVDELYAHRREAGFFLRERDGVIHGGYAGFVLDGLKGDARAFLSSHLLPLPD